MHSFIKVAITILLIGLANPSYASRVIDANSLKKKDGLTYNAAWKKWRKLIRQQKVPSKVACMAFNGELRIFFIKPKKMPGYIWVWTWGQNIRHVKADYRKRGYRLHYHHDLRAGPRGKLKKIVAQCAIMIKRGTPEDF